MRRAGSSSVVYPGRQKNIGGWWTVCVAAYFASRSGRVLVHLKHFGLVANRLFFASSDKVFAHATEVLTEVSYQLLRINY